MNFVIIALIAYLSIREIIFFIEKKAMNKKQNDLLDRLMSKDFNEYKRSVETPEETVEDLPDYHTPLSEIEDIDLITNG